MDDPHALAESVAAPQEDPTAMPPTRQSLVGKQLDHYQVSKLIGQGGMGEVYEATDTSLGRRVAIKVVRAEITAKPGMTERFLHEARAQARFNHPNIVHIYYIGHRPTAEGEDSLFFAMERVGGGDLEDVLSGGLTMPIEEARQAMIHVARGLRAAQRVGLIHRDIKPSNLMVGEDGVIKIADFGLAKPMDAESDIAPVGSLVGSPYYIAPEQVIGDTLDFRADMYSMGAAFHHLLVGRPPFEGQQAMAVIAKHLSDDVEPLADSAPHVPERLARIVEKLLAKMPADRYRDYDALIVDLERAAPTAQQLAPFTTRAVAVLGDFLLAGLLIGFFGWIGLVVYLVLVTVGVRLRGQSPAKYLLGIMVRRDDGSRIGWLRAITRTLVSFWLPILVVGTIAVSAGLPELLETLEGVSWLTHQRSHEVEPALREESIRNLENLLIVLGLSHAILTVLYVIGLIVAFFHPEGKTVHDMFVGSVVVYRSRPAVVASHPGRASAIPSERPPPPGPAPDDTIA